MNKFVEAIRRLLLIITWLPTTVFVCYALLCFVMPWLMHLTGLVQKREKRKLEKSGSTDFPDALSSSLTLLGFFLLE